MSNESPTITPHKAREIAAENTAVILLDVRTPTEFSARRAVGARNIPLDTIPATIAAGELSKNSTICILCEKGGRAAIAADHLLKAGHRDVHVVTGGTEAWADDGLPIEGTGRKIISIERQVRIGAGSLVLTGIIFGFLMHPAFFALSAFIGAGLIFAGITDWCGMGLLLARAPWNR
jgi:rhodanese-related sulfurtransferase